MIRIALAFTAILALMDAYGQDRMAAEIAFYTCVQQTTGWTCPSRGPKVVIQRQFTYKHAVIYCQCRVDTQWDELQEPLCQAITRACELGDI